MSAFYEKTLDFLGLASKKNVVEQFIKKDDEIKTMGRMLESATEDIDTKPSELALDTKKLSTTEGDAAVIRVEPEKLQNLYYTNQFCFRGINIRADAIVAKGYKILGSNEKNNEYCEKLIKRSGGASLFHQLSINADVCGDGFLEKIKNKAGTDLMFLKHIHPVTFGFFTTETTAQKGGVYNLHGTATQVLSRSLKYNNERIVVDKNGNPVAYQQKIRGEDGKEVITKVDKERIVHLIFNKFGDEFTGISTLQPVYLTAKRLMSMEEAAAFAAVRTENPLYIATFDTKSPHEIAKWARIIGRLSGKDQAFFPKGVELKMLSPGNQNFNDYADYFLNSVVSSTGVPKGRLIGVSEGSNRATGVIQSRDFNLSMRRNQQSISDLFAEIFKEIAVLKNWNENDTPELKFGDVAEDAIDAGTQAIELFTAGVINQEEARLMIGLEGTVKTEQTDPTKIRKPAGDADEVAVKKSDKEVFHPEKQGSQVNTKRNQKKDKDSEFKGDEKRKV